LRSAKVRTSNLDAPGCIARQPLSWLVCDVCVI
jgi:hypothetical protein